MIIRMSLALALMVGAIYLTPPTPQLWGRERVGSDPMVRVAAMKRRAQVLQETGDEVIRKYVRDVSPLEYALLRFGRVRDPRQARLAAWAIVRETETRHLSPQLIASLMKVEDPWLVPDTVSSAGAVGWMQIMPMHVYDGHPCGTDLTDGDVNVCYGTTILREYIGRALDRALREALLAYNGCVSTPGCELYADRVLAGVNN